MIEVIEIFEWHHHRNIAGGGGITSQLTHCRFNGIDFWVRENINNINSFEEVSSGERFGQKEGFSIRKSRQCLEILCPANQEHYFCDLVAASDGLKRAVKTNREFTLQWIRANIKNENIY